MYLQGKPRNEKGSYHMELKPNYDHLGNDNKQIVAEGLMEIILQANGSTTRMLEAIVGGELTLNIHQQGIVARESLPSEFVRYFDAEGPFLRRIISLCYRGEVLSDNHVLACLETIGSELQTGLIRGQIPLGRLINDIESRRVIIQAGYQNADQLQPYIKPARLMSNIYPVKKYLILHDQKCWFHICEVFHVKTILNCFYAAERKIPFDSTR